MKKLYNIFIIIFLILFLTACAPIQAEPVTIVETIVVTETVEVENTERIDELESEVQQYQNLIANLNDLLKNIYYVYGEGGGTWVEGIGFALEYKNKFYLITAGHAVDGEWGIHKNLGFKSIDNEWIYPKLLTYEVTDTVPDYAIYYSDKIDNGLEYDLNNSEPDYRLGINKLIQENNNWGVDGECGSPIIDLDGEVIGIHVGYLSDIDNVLEAIDSLEK